MIAPAESEETMTLPLPRPPPPGGGDTVAVWMAEFSGPNPDAQSSTTPCPSHVSSSQSHVPAQRGGGRAASRGFVCFLLNWAASF